MKRLLLIDAYAMIYRAYYAFIRIPRMNSKGMNTSAIYGFVTTLEDLVKRLKPTHIAVGFDPHGPTFRHEAYADYKAQREETPEDIRAAVPVIEKLLEAMNIPVLVVPGYEADDVIGTVAGIAEKEGFEVFMATPDKDYGQLVTENIHIYRPRHTGGFEQMGPVEVCAKYGLHNTQQIVDLLGLMGDASDNIPGCKGVGEKTAVALLNQFGSIENMLAHTEELKGALRTKVESQAEQIRFSRFLATIKTDVPLAEEFRVDSLVFREKDWTKLTPLYEELEFNSLLKNVPERSQLSTLNSKQKKQEATLDLFADNSPSANEVSGLTDAVGLTGAAGLSAEGGLTAQRAVNNIESRLCSYLLNPEASFNPNAEPNWDALKADSALWNLYNEVELPLVPVLRSMEEAGVRFDIDILRQAEKQLTEEAQVIEQRIFDSVGRTFNVNSPKQVGEVLFDHLRLDPKAKKSQKGAYSTSEEVLLGIRDKHEVVDMILDYRELKKLISTYVTALPGYINPKTGKIHTTYNQTVTATGRLSSSNPNLQNLPIRSERGQLIRRAVIPDEGCLFLSADYSQIELRLMAHLSQDKHLIDAFRKGQDIHAATAAKIFKVPLEEVTKEQRRRAKTANFGIIYGISAFGLAQQLQCPRGEAKQLIDDYFAAFPDIIAFIEAQKTKARAQGYVETLFGRKRYLPDINSQNSVVRSFAERNSVNAPIQGTAADIIKMAMVGIAHELKQQNLKAQMIMQVHDELNFNVPKDEIEQVKQIVIEQMQNVVHLSVPLLAEVGVGSNWLEAH